MTLDPVIIIDYGMGNLASIQNMFNSLGVDASITPDPGLIRQARKLVLAGVGAFDAGMSNLRRQGLAEALNDKVVREKTPILGICLGMQLFTRASEEGEAPGLGWLEARTVRFVPPVGQACLKIPHMGWNGVHPLRPGRLLEGLSDDARFYFAHSYHVVCDDPSAALCTTRYGYDFMSAVEAGNVHGVQFHPEKSHRYGKILLQNFARG